MCDPLTAIMGILSIGASFMQYQSQMAAINAQNDANAQWVAWQQQKAREENARQEELRQRAEASRQEALQKQQAGEQDKAQQSEAERVKNLITPKGMADDPNLPPEQTIGDKLLSGQAGAAEPVKQDIANQITQASRDARARIAALATLQSYGPTSFSMQNRANDVFTQAGQNIQLVGDLRSGSLAAYGAEKQVQPRQIQASPSMWGGLASGLAGIAGKSFGRIS